MSRPFLVRAVLWAAVLSVAGCQPHGPEALRRGDELLRAGRTAEAIPLLERAATELPAEPRAWNFLGLAYHAAGRPAEAEKSYLRALREDRDFFGAHHNLGVLYAGQGNWAEAERSLRTFLAPDANRNHPVATHLLGQAQLQLRKLDDAERTLALAAKLAPADADVWNDLGLLHTAKRRWANARQAFAWAVRLDPRHSAARLNLAVTAQQLGDPRGALQAYQEYLAVAPTAPNAEEVRALVRQLGPAIVTAPPVAPLTNAVATAKLMTNPAAKSPAPPTNSVPARLAAPVATKPAAKPVIEPKPAPARLVEQAAAKPANTPPPTNASAVTAKPALATPPPEVVRVEEPPSLQPARDTIPPSGPPGTNAAPAVATVVETSASSPATDDLAEPSPAQRRGFWQRVNPVSWGNPVKWFRGAPTPEKTATPLQVTSVRPVSVAAADKLPPLTNTNVPVPALPAPAPIPKPKPPKPVVARYAARAPATLPEGNRAEAERQFNAAVAAHDRRDLPGALALYQRAAELDPAHFAAHHNLGLAALESGDLPRALLAGECATRLDPRSVPARRLFAATLQRANYPADAAEQLARLVVLEPTDAAAHLALAGLHARSLGEPELARPHYERVLALKPDHPQAGPIRVWLAENP